MFGGSGFSLTKAQLQAEESKGKVLEAINFLVRGVRLLGSDAQNSVRLITKAALGENLVPLAQFAHIDHLNQQQLSPDPFPC